MPTDSTAVAAMPEQAKGTRNRRFFRPLRTDWYIITEVFGPFMGGLVFFTFVFLMFQVLRLAEFFIVHGVSLQILGRMVTLLMLSFLPMALPVAFLVAVLVGFGRLSADSETVALKASGFSLARLSIPVTLLALGVVTLSLFLNLEWVPWGERSFKNLLVKVGNTKVISSIKEGTFTTGFFDLLIFADKVDAKSNRMQRVFIFDEREPKNPLTVVAKTGEVVPIKTTSELGSAIVLRLFNGSIHRNDPSNGTYTKIDFGEYKLYLKIDEGISNAVIKPQMIPINHLLAEVKKTNISTYHGREMRGELWRRIAIALTPLFFVFIGIGFGTVRTRAVRAGAALVSFIVLILYWSMLSASTVAYQRALIHPAVAMQIPNLVLALVGLYLFRKSSW